MDPRIDDTGFGYIVVDGSKIPNDIVIGLSGEITKRKKKLSKKLYGTSHIVSEQEAKHIYQSKAERLIIGSGQYGRLGLSDEAARFFLEGKCEVELLPTPEAIKRWNEVKGRVIGLFHVTC